MRKYFLMLFVIYPILAFSSEPEITKQDLVGEWNVVGVKAGGKGDFQAPLQPASWEFTKEGKFKEKLGGNEAQIHWNYKINNGEIQTSFGSMAFSWKILSRKEKVIVVKHHLGIFKIERK